APAGEGRRLRSGQAGGEARDPRRQRVRGARAPLGSTGRHGGGAGGLPASGGRVRRRDGDDDRRRPRRLPGRRGRDRPRPQADRAHPSRVPAPEPAGPRHPAGGAPAGPRTSLMPRRLMDRGGDGRGREGRRAVRWGRLAVENYRGRLVPRTLGLWLALCATASTLVVDAARPLGPAGWGGLACLLLVAAAGLVDDLVPIGPRGLAGHLRALVHGHMTTGVLKLLVGGGCAVIAIGLQPRRHVPIELAGMVLVAAATNVWNGLDVAPGRALKAFLPVELGALLAGPAVELLPFGVGLAAGAAIGLVLDVLERAMLGDAGSNPLGFAAGLSLYVVLPDPAVVAAAALAVALNVLAETVTLTRAIRAVPPLRWLD